MTAIQDLFKRTITQVLKFKLGLEIYTYTMDKMLSNYREFEAELEVDYPIKGTEVNFNTKIFATWRNLYDNHLIINNDKLISSIDITDEMSSEPFRHKEMAFVFLFSVLEGFGNSLVNIVNVDYYNRHLKEGGSWHQSINPKNKAKGKDLVELFGIPFNVQKSNIQEKFVTLFFELKQKRNSIVHDLTYDNIQQFESDIESIIVLICYIYHINNQSSSIETFYPWPDYD